jgi:hypothetical protein
MQPPVEHSRASEEEIASLFPHLRMSDAFDGASASEARAPTATPAAAPTCQPAPAAAPTVSAAAAAAATSALERPMCVIAWTRRRACCCCRAITFRCAAAPRAPP